MLYIDIFAFNQFQENTYVVSDEQKNCVIIDPGCYTSEEEEAITSFIIENNLKVVKKLFNEGAQIIITTSRDKSEKDYIKNLLNINGIYPYEIICGLNHSERIIINDYFDTNPYPTASAINLERNGDLSSFLNF